MKSVIAAAALVATTAASAAGDGVYNFNSTCDTNLPHTKIVNRCSYPVYLWSIGKQYGCPQDSGLELKTGDFYHENFQNGTKVIGGVSIKLSKFPTCGGKDITQLEYHIETEDEAFKGNFLDMSFVDCVRNPEDCPGRTDGFYLKSGNQNGMFKSAVNNEHCPIFNVEDAEEAARVAYVLPDDRQTKYCNEDANLELYLCGGQAPSAEDNYSAPSSSTEAKSSSAQSSSSSSKEAASSTSEEANFVVAAAAAITEAPVPAPAAPVIKTEVVYVTEYVKARHAHGRRHQQFHG